MARRESLRRRAADSEGLHVALGQWDALQSSHTALSEMTRAEADPEMLELARLDLADTEHRLLDQEQLIKAILLRPSEDDKAAAILEVRPATGGDEAGIFAAELFAMYERFAALHGWQFEPVSVAEEGGSLKEGIAQINGANVFGRLKWESGVHRVQRVPVTENQGRIHTSTVTVAIMPLASSGHAVQIPEKDIRVDVYRSSGAGGQNANKTNSAVRVVHIPTGTTVCIQEERSQQTNRARAMAILHARLQQLSRKASDSERQKTRQAQIGHGDRAEKIRTYNFPQGRVTDHRANHSIFCIEEFMKEARGLDQLVDRLHLHDEAAKLAELENN